MNLISQIEKEASESEVDQYSTQFAFRDLDEGRLSLTITHFNNGGDGHIKKITTRKSWCFKGKAVKASDLYKLFP